MSLQLPAILSPPTPCIPSPALTVSPLEEVAEVALPFTGRRPVLGFAHPTQARQCTRPYRVQHCFIYGLQFVSGCFPPRLSTTQLPSTTDSRCSVRWGLPPHCWCALSGARRVSLSRVRRHMPRRSSLAPQRTRPWTIGAEALSQLASVHLLGGV